MNCIKILNWHLVRDSLQVNVIKSGDAGDTIENQEIIPAILDEYREKLYHLQRLDPE